MLTPADDLRRAAATLRERAEAATPGPWWNDPSLGNVIFSGTGLSDDIAVTEDFDKRSDADYIATMHPLVGLALADWLDAVAEDAQSNDDNDGLDPYLTICGYASALKVARLITASAS